MYIVNMLVHVHVHVVCQGDFSSASSVASVAECPYNKTDNVLVYMFKLSFIKAVLVCCFVMSWVSKLQCMCTVYIQVLYMYVQCTH